MSEERGQGRESLAECGARGRGSISEPEIMTWPISRVGCSNHWAIHVPLQDILSVCIPSQQQHFLWIQTPFIFQPYRTPLLYGGDHDFAQGIRETWLLIKGNKSLARHLCYSTILLIKQPLDGLTFLLPLELFWSFKGHRCFLGEKIGSMFPRAGLCVKMELVEIMNVLWKEPVVFIGSF